MVSTIDASARSKALDIIKSSMRELIDQIERGENQH